MGLVRVPCHLKKNLATTKRTLSLVNIEQLQKLNSFRILRVGGCYETPVRYVTKTVDKDNICPQQNQS